ncbi:MAG TPA: branched-chain amino acid ABC transporter permease [Solirubrobacteraceae bacterium]|nr:branched-chain amino acid ABC transporter permease [Solirubrobacteraceae bacterium]
MSTVTAPTDQTPAKTRGRRPKLPPWAERAFIPIFFVVAALLPLFMEKAGTPIHVSTLALAYIVMALGLNIIVGFAGLLDLGYVAFFAIGAYTMGWFGSDFFSAVNNGEGIHIVVSDFSQNLAGIHLNFVIVVIAAIVFCAIAGMIIGLPTLRLRGDYIAIVTLAFGEIIGRIAVNGDDDIMKLSSWPVVGGLFENWFGPDQTLTAGRQGIAPVDKIYFPGIEPFQLLDKRPWFWVALGMVAIVLFVNFRLRDSRLGRAWVALREDEVAAVSMGVPAVKTKLLAYGTGAAFGGMAGAFLGTYLQIVNADQFQFYFSILVLGMVILGGLGSIWGVVLGAIVLSLINNWLIPDVLRTLPEKFGQDFDMSQLSFGIYGFLLVMMMILRPQGLLPERRREAEMTHSDEHAEESVFVARA